MMTADGGGAAVAAVLQTTDTAAAAAVNNENKAATTAAAEKKFVSEEEAEEEDAALEREEEKMMMEGLVVTSLEHDDDDDDVNDHLDAAANHLERGMLAVALVKSVVETSSSRKNSNDDSMMLPPSSTATSCSGIKGQENVCLVQQHQQPQGSGEKPKQEPASPSSQKRYGLRKRPQNHSYKPSPTSRATRSVKRGRVHHKHEPKHETPPELPLVMPENQTNAMIKKEDIGPQQQQSHGEHATAAPVAVNKQEETNDFPTSAIKHAASAAAPQTNTCISSSSLLPDPTMPLTTATTTTTRSFSAADATTNSNLDDSSGGCSALPPIATTTTSQHDALVTSQPMGNAAATATPVTAQNAQPPCMPFPRERVFSIDMDPQVFEFDSSVIDPLQNRPETIDTQAAPLNPLPTPRSSTRRTAAPPPPPLPVKKQTTFASYPATADPLAPSAPISSTSSSSSMTAVRPTATASMTTTTMAAPSNTTAVGTTSSAAAAPVASMTTSTSNGGSGLNTPAMGSTGGGSRDRGYSFEFFSLGINAEEPLPPVPTQETVAPPTSTVTSSGIKTEQSEQSAGFVSRPRGDSIIFDPMSFCDGGIHEENALLKSRLASSSTAAPQDNAEDNDELTLMNTPGFVEAPPSSIPPPTQHRTGPGAMQRHAAVSTPLGGVHNSSSSSSNGLILANDSRAYTTTSTTVGGKSGPQILPANGGNMVPIAAGSTVGGGAAPSQTIPSSLVGTPLAHSPCPMELLNKGGRIGIYLPDARRARIAKFHSKRAMRIWRKRIKYDCRKKLADSRPRIKGRFVKRSDMEEED